MPDDQPLPDGLLEVAKTANPDYVNFMGTMPNLARELAKSTRQAAVDRIRVTTSSGKVFDGDEVSQGRMVRAIVAMQAIGAPDIVWVLADNTPTTVTPAELAEALALAGLEQSRLWVLP